MLLPKSKHNPDKDKVSNLSNAGIPIKNKDLQENQKRKGLLEPKESRMHVVAKQFHLINPINLKM